MQALVVLSNLRDWPGAVPGAAVVTARTYLTDPAYGAAPNWRVFNLCSSFQYQSLGYYVSLLAEARGHKPLPRVATIEDLRSQNLVKSLTAHVDGGLDHTFATLQSDRFVLSIYFGRNMGQRYDTLAKHVFDCLQAPLMRAEFERRDGRWHVHSVRAISLSGVPAAHQDFMVESAAAFFSGRLPRVKKRNDTRFDLAILHDPDNPEPPSNPRALHKFAQAADSLGLRVEWITRHDFGRLAQFDALFVRDTTQVNHYTYRFSRRAWASGLVVIDDPESILKCNNKVYLAELLARHGVPTPKTLLIHRDNAGDILTQLTLPCVLKQPDSAFSLGVMKASTPAELDAALTRLLAKSDLIIAQEWLPTAFDWRVGVLDRRVLFVARYYMVPGHWQIVQHSGPAFREGATEAVPKDRVPPAVLRLGLKAANLIGDGFYGVDLKQTGKRTVVIEVNDNPNVDAGNEDAVLGDALYREVMGTFLRRIEERHPVKSIGALA